MRSIANQGTAAQHGQANLIDLFRGKGEFTIRYPDRHRIVLTAKSKAGLRRLLRGHLRVEAEALIQAKRLRRIGGHDEAAFFGERVDAIRRARARPFDLAAVQFARIEAKEQRRLTILTYVDSIKFMITSFRCSDTEALFNGRRVVRFANIEKSALRKLAVLNRVDTLDDLRVPPGNRLHRLSGDREGQYSIRINEQWRICFDFADGQAENVEIVDYH
jgi:proteic killer suppression protein